MRFEKAKKPFKFSRVENGDALEIVTEYPQYDSMQDFINVMGDEDKALGYVNSAVRADSGQALSVYAKSVALKELSDEDFAAKIQERRRNFNPATSGRSDVSKKEAADIGFAVMEFMSKNAGRAISPEELEKLLAGVRS